MGLLMLLLFCFCHPKPAPVPDFRVLLSVWIATLTKGEVFVFGNGAELKGAEQRWRGKAPTVASYAIIFSC